MSKLVQVALAAMAVVVGYGSYRLFSTPVDRVTDTHLWLYRADARPLEEAKVDVDVRHPPGRGDFAHAQTVTTGADGRAIFARERVRKVYLPIPHGSGPGDYEQRFTARVLGAPHALGTSSSARTAQFVFEDGKRRHSLLFLHDYDPFRDSDGFSMECARDVEELAASERFLAGPATASFGKEVRARLFARARAKGMTPYDDAFDGSWRSRCAARRRSTAPSWCSSPTRVTKRRQVSTRRDPHGVVLQPPAYLLGQAEFVECDWMKLYQPGPSIGPQLWVGSLGQ